LTVEKRREDAHALPKLRETRRTFRRISHCLPACVREVPSECDASSHRFWEAEHRLPLGLSLLDEFSAACERSMFEMSVEYTDAPTTRPESTAADQMPCPYCGHLLPKDAQSCDRCDWKRGATETAEGKASDAVAVILSIIPGLGHIYKGHKLAGFLWMAGAIPVGIFVLLAAVASAGFGIGLFFFYLIAVMLHAYAVDDRVVTPKEDEGEEY
jgi:hypothetical protein